MFVEGLRRQGGIPVPQCVSDALLGKAIDIRDATPLMADIKVGRPVEKPVPMQCGQGASNGARVAFRDGVVPQKLGRIIRAEAEKLREEFEDPLFGRVAAGEVRTVMRGWLPDWRHPFILRLRRERARVHDLPRRNAS